MFENFASLHCRFYNNKYRSWESSFPFLYFLKVVISVYSMYIHIWCWCRPLPTHVSVSTRLTKKKQKKWFLPQTHRLGSWGSCYRSNHGRQKRDAYKHTGQVHTHTHTTDTHLINSSDSSQEVTLSQHTHTLPKKGGKGYRQEAWELQGQQVTLLMEEILNGTGRRKCTHTLAGSDATLRSYGLWHSVGSHRIGGQTSGLFTFVFFLTKSCRTTFFDMLGIFFSEVDEKINITPMSAW